MPLLQFDCNFAVDADEKRAFAAAVTDLYADRMATGTDHVAVVVREHDQSNLALGRVEDPGAGVVFLNADVRAGRTADQRRAFALAVMDEITDRWGVPEPNVKVVFTEHAGPEMMGYDRVGEDWTPDEA